MNFFIFMILWRAEGCKTCANCERPKPQSEFSKAQWLSRDRWCSKCMAQRKSAKLSDSRNAAEATKRQRKEDQPTQARDLPESSPGPGCGATINAEESLQKTICRIPWNFQKSRCLLEKLQESLQKTFQGAPCRFQATPGAS